MRKLFTLQSSILILLLSLSIKSIGQISITTPGAPVSQNFDTMLGTSATAILTTNQWRVADNAGGTTWAGANRTATTQLGGTAAAVSAGGIYNYGNGAAATATDRALGFLSSGTNPFPGTSSTPLSIYAQYNNATGASIVQFSGSFDYEKYRNGTNVNGWTFSFYYSLDGTTWINVPDGNQTYPADAANTAVAPAGTTSKSFTITGISIPNGSNFYLRWSYFVSAGTTATNAQGLAIDNVSITGSNTVTTTPALTITPGSLNFPNTTLGNNSTLTYSLKGADLTNDITVSTSAPYSVSRDNITFETSINIDKTDPQLVAGKTIYVKFSPTAAGSNPGSVNNISANASTKTVSLTGSGIGLISLATSPYIQNFDAIGTALPTGVTVKTGATVSALGNDATFSTAKVSWSSTTGAFKNFASGNNDQAVTQANATDRALGVRQIGTFGDPGAAFVFQLANTTNKINFSLDFNLQSLDATSERVTTWRIDYGFGVAPTSFTVPVTTGILTTGGNIFSNNPVHVDFGNALDDQPGIVTIRIVAITNSTGANNRPSTGIDNFNLTWEDPTAKTLSLSTAAINFPTTNIGTTSVLTYNIVGQTNLDQPIVLTATAPYTISASADDAGFSSSISIVPADAFNKTIYVKFSPLTAGIYPGTITHSSEGITTKNVTLSAEAVDPAALSFNFNTCTVSNIPGSGFLSINVTGTQKWGCSQYGRNSTNGVDMNGFSGGAAQTNDTWLISPALNLNNIANLPVLSFYSRGEFSGPKLQLYVSTTYNGSGVPNLGDWTEITTANFPPPTGGATTTWTLSDNIDLSAYKNAAKIYIAFRYTSSPALNAARWSVDDIAITDQSTLLSVSPSQLSFGEVSVGSNSPGQPVSFQAIGGNDLTITPPAGYQISTDNSTFSANAIVISQATAAAGTTLYVRFSPVVKALTVEGNINVTAEGLNKDIVAVTGSSYPKSETFDVACYNISFFGSNSTNSATPEQIATQVANISTVMQRLNMDIIGIEEMSNDDALNQLVNNLPGYDKVMSHRWSYSFEPADPNFPPQKVGFIYNTSTMTLSTTEPPRAMFESMYDSARSGLPGHRLADYPTGTPSSFWGSGRLPFMATFDATVDGVSQTIRFIVIHAKSGGDADGYTRRQYDVKVLKDSLDVMYPNDKIIILGDYNDRMVTSIFVGHPSSYLPFVNDPANYNILTLPLDQAGRTTFPSSNGMIDHITTSNELTTEYISGSVGIEDPRLYIANYNASTGSDHLPVYTRYRFCGTFTPTVSVSENGAPAFCEGGSVLLSSTAAASYQWYKDGVAIENATGQTYNATEVGSYTAVVVNSNGCSSGTSNSIAVTSKASTTSSTEISSCTSYTWNGTEYTTSGDYDFHTINSVGCDSTATLHLTIEDLLDPTITPPAAVSVSADNGSCAATNVSLGTPVTADNCAVATVSNDAPSSFPVGATIVTWTVTDTHGRTATATQTVTVTDTQKPTITCVANQSLLVNNTDCSYKVPGGEFDPSAFADNCPGATITNNFNNSNTLAGAVFPKGITTVIWTVTDAHGNTANCTTTITVNSTIASSIADVYAVQPGGAANTVYIGYGPSSLTLNAAVSGGGGGYAFKWTVGSSAGPGLNTTASYTVTPTATTTYYFNVKDMFGCSAPVVTKTVYRTDVRCGPKLDKVTVCETVKGKTSTNCIAQKDVAGALANGAYLGACNEATPTTRTNGHGNKHNSLSVLSLNAMPNPSASYFMLQINGAAGAGKISLRVTDILGRVVEQRNNVQAGSTIQIGSAYRKGVYIAELLQGTNREQIKLVKTE